MNPCREDLLVDLGSSFARSFTYFGADGVAPDLSTWSANLAFKRYPGALTAFLSLSSDAGITLGPEGAIAIAMTPAQTSALDLPRFMDWGPFPGEGTMASPNDGNVAGRLGAWELRLTNADNSISFVPLAGIACFREGPTGPVAASVLPGYDISVEPQESTVSWNSSGYQIGAPLVLAVTITRRNGHTAPINIALPMMDGPWTGWTAVVNGVTVTALEAQHQPYLLDAAPDFFTIEFYGTQAGWSVESWQGGVQIIGDDGSGTLVRSNVFSIIT